MTLYDIMYFVGGIVGIICITIIFSPAKSERVRMAMVVLLLGGFGVVAYLVLGSSPVPENPMFPIPIYFGHVASQL